MFTKLWRKPLLVFEGLFLFLLAAAFLFGDKSQPNITSLPSNLTINQPIIISFDRPIEHINLGTEISLAHGSTNIAGSFTWSTDSVAFSPNYPLNYATSYTLSITGVKDIEGHAMKNTVKQDYTTISPRFLYINQDYELRMYNVPAKTSVQVSEAGEKVLGYSLSPDGAHVVLDSMTSAGESEVSYLSILASGAVTKRNTVLESSTITYPQASLCNNGSDLLVYEQTLSDTGTLINYPVAESGLQPSVVLVPSSNVTNGQFACAESSDQFLYYNGHISVTLASISDPSNQVAIGQATSIIGFSPNEKEILLEEITTIPTIQETIDSVGSTGIKTALSNSLGNAVGPSYNASETELALAEDDNPQDIAVQDWHYQVIVQTKYQGIIFKTDLTVPTATITNIQPIWSADGSYLSFEQAASLLNGSANRPTDLQGNYLDGTIMLAQFDPTKTFIQQLPTPQKLNITGGDVTWVAG